MTLSRTTLATALLGLAGLFTAATAPAAVIHEEALDGDFSNLGTTPTALGTLAQGSSTVGGRLANNFENSTEDPADVFSFVLAAGTRLSALAFSFNQTLYPNGADFALYAGATTGTGSDQLGAFNTRQPGVASGLDLLTQAFYSGANPLGPGSYTVALRGVGESFGLDRYSLDFSVVDAGAPQQVPEPASALLVAGSLLALAATRARRRRA